MITLIKLPQPKILIQKGAEWTRAILEKLSRGETLTKSDKSHYNHPEIKSAIVQETHGKCAYCESKIRHVSFGDIEHIIPKSHAPALCFTWENLTLACDVCNTNKGDHYDPNLKLVDPYTDDLKDHLTFLGALLVPQLDSESGLMTEKILDLNRAPLVERRHEKIKYLLKHLQVIKKTLNEPLRKILLADLMKECESDREFAGLAKAFIQDAKEKLHVEGI